jgi:hypothetical protein
MAQIDPQYTIKQIERVQKAVKYQNAKAERQIIKVRKQHERHLRRTDEGLGISMVAFEAYAVKESAPIDYESISLLDKNEGEMESDALEQTIMRIRDKADQMIKAARKHCAMRCWTCADDGLAYPFEYRGHHYYRTYSGTMWHAVEGQLGAWAGVWNGKYIGKGEEPQQKPPVA